MRIEFIKLLHLIYRIGARLVEHDQFDTLLKLIKEQLKRDKKLDLLVLNADVYEQFKAKNTLADKPQRLTYDEPHILAEIKYYESPLQNPNSTVSTAASTKLIQQQAQSGGTMRSAISSASEINASHEPRLCHLLTWSNYNGYGFFVGYFSNKYEKKLIDL